MVIALQKNKAKFAEVIPEIREKAIFSHTFLTSFSIFSVQQQEAGRLWQEGQCEELEQRGYSVDTKQPGPVFLCAK